MSHPFQAHRQNAKERSRVSHITRGYAAGGGVHSDEPQDKAMIKNMVKKTALKLAGGAVSSRADRPNRARGGKVGGKRGNVVNVIIAPQEPKLAAPPGVNAGVPPPPMPMPMRPPVLPPSSSGGMAPPGGGVAAPPPGVLPRARGGAVKHAGGGKVVKPNFPNDIKSTFIDKPPQPIPQEDKDKLKELSRAFGGRATAADAGIGKGRTPVQHTNNKQDGVNIGRKAALTK